MKTRIVLVVVAVVLGVFAAIVAVRYIEGARQDVAQQSKPVEVYVARSACQAGLSLEELIKRQLVERQQVPARFVPQGAVSSVSGVDGQVLCNAVNPGVQLTRDNFSFPADAGLSFALQPKQVAITVSVDDVSGVAGLIKPGDWVTLVSSFDAGATGKPVTMVLLPKVRVIAVGQSTGVERSNKAQPASNTMGNAQAAPTQANQATARTVTLAVQPRDVEKVVFTQQQGKASFALLPPVGAQTPAGRGVTVNNVFAR